MMKKMLRDGFMMVLGSLALVLAACAGGSTLGTTEDGGTSGTSGTAGASGTAGTSGACTEFHPGEQNDVGIGGSAQSQVNAQGIADLAGATNTQVTDLTASCKKLAVAAGALSSDQTAADAVADALDKMKGWCALAASAVSAAKANAGGTLTLNRGASSCKLSVPTKGICQGRCSGTGTCDLAANPVKCRGGTLAGGYCEGGKLEGGCQVGAKCDASCDVTVAAGALCSAPTVATSVAGAANPSAALALQSALDANLPTIFALQMHFEEEADLAGVAGAVEVTDLEKPVCIFKVLHAAQAAIDAIEAGASASASVVAVVD
jgi:hypothetical protein